MIHNKTQFNHLLVWLQRQIFFCHCNSFPIFLYKNPFHLHLINKQNRFLLVVGIKFEVKHFQIFLSLSFNLSQLSISLGKKNNLKERVSENQRADLLSEKHRCVTNNADDDCYIQVSQ